MDITSRDDYPQFVVHHLNEFLFEIRKLFGMFGQIQFRISDIDRKVLSVEIWERKENADPTTTITHVRNTLINIFGDLLPCKEFSADYTNPARGIENRQFTLDFSWQDRPLPSPLILVEENFEIHKQRNFPLLKALIGELH